MGQIVLASRRRSGPCPLQNRGRAKTRALSSGAPHSRAVARTAQTRVKMSHLKVLRGNFARQLFKTFSGNTKRNRRCRNFVSASGAPASRSYATLPEPDLENRTLTSPWGEIKIGKETLTEYIFQDVELWMDKPAVTCGATGRSYNYGMLRMLVERCACALLSALRMKPGDKIGLILPNIPEFAVLIQGSIRAGLTVTFANPLYTADEIQRQFADCGVTAIATIEMFMPAAVRVAESLPGYKGTIFVGGEHDASKKIFGLKSLLMEDHETDMPDVNCEEVCLIPYSSGTTGMPKGVMLTHKNLVSNLKQIHCPKLMKHGGEKGHDETVLTVPPFFHIYGFNGILNYNLTLGFHIVSIPRFTPEDYVKCLVEYKPTILFVVPALLTFLATHPMVKKEHIESVEGIMVGAAPMTDVMLEKFLIKCEKTKDDIRILQGYGMTESSPVTLMTPYTYPHSKIGSVGQLMPSTQARVVSLATGEALGPHKSGELLLKGPQVMKGYWNNEAATRETLDANGWLHTGDVAYYDEDHYFYIVDRTKELIKVKGNQVSPTELESVIMELPEVADAAVVGMPDPLAGEIPKAFVVLKPNQKLTEKQVYDQVASKLTKYKHLEGGVVFLDSIPRNVAGKIMRNELKVLRPKKA
ncbi:Probable 4-coumarate--CoA ligase 1 [Eumeta japonica]|uniref:Luciferin 4-monooxygenase n=1 Tax=Eumeta variegata TaxID=151549 RepID=A0A4C1WEX1_EUMVA|nr:Probable 4-coumarate--CoA ligase 1 [Eumeta japonica]